MCNEVQKHMKLAYIKQRYINDCAITTTTSRSTSEGFWYGVDCNWFFPEPVTAKGLSCAMVKFKKV